MRAADASGDVLRKNIQGVSMRLSMFQVFLLLLVFCGCPGASQNSDKQLVVSPASKAEVVRFCADCHAYPDPETFPAFMWREEVEQGYRFYNDSHRKDLDPPDLEAVVAYYESLAPEELEIPIPENPEQQGSIKFTEQILDRAENPVPAITHLNFRPSKDGQPASLIVCDMRSSDVSQLTFSLEKPSMTSLAQVPFPVHLDRTDLDSDGNEDWIISDLGGGKPSDDLFGELDWLQKSNDGENQNVQTILQGVGRIADARAADFDGDGDQDVIVAIFGWRKAGKLIWLEQLSPEEDGQLRFKEHLLDKRHGYSHVPLVDIDGDGDMDFIALISQEFEAIELFRNNGEGKFQKTVIYTAGNPSFGSSSIDLSDLDGDGDMDVIYTNGDSLDSHMIKPYHAIHWLENLDNRQFTHHHVANLPGAYGVKAGDIDGDGDLDLVACTMTMVFDHNFHSLVWFEQNEKEFELHNIEASFRQHACLELGDFDSDGDLDIAVGHFEVRPVKKADWISIWWNDGKREIAPQSRTD